MTGADFATLGLRVSATQGIQELDRYESSAKRATQSTTLLEAGVQSLNKVYKLFGAALAGVSLARIASETSSAQRAFAVMDATVRATGGAAGRTSLQLAEMASSIQQVSEFGDDLVQGGLTRLLTYTTIAGDTFDRTAMAAVNMAAALGTDVAQAAETLGRALEYPEHATSALARQGFRFSEAQRAMIAEFVRTGQQARAQSIILEELERVYNGVAEAARNTLGGALAGLRNAFGDLLELPEKDSESLRRSIESTTSSLQRLKQAIDDSGAVTIFFRELGNLGNGAAAAFTQFREWGNQVNLIGTQIDGFREALDGLTRFDMEAYRQGVAKNQAATDQYRQSIERANTALREARELEKASRQPQLSQAGADYLTRLHGGTPGVKNDGGPFGMFSNAPLIATQTVRAAREITAAVEVVSEAYRKASLTAELARDRQQALNAVLGSSAAVVEEINAQFDLKAKLQSIDADASGANASITTQQAERLKGLARALFDLEKVQRDFARARAEEEQIAREAAERWARERRDREEYTRAVEDAEAAVRRIAEARESAMQSAEQEVQGQRDQIELLKLRGEAARKLGDSLLYAAKYQQFLDQSKGGGAVGDPLWADQMAKAFVANQREIDRLRSTTKSWADELRQVVGIAQLLSNAAGAFGQDWSRAISQVLNSVHSVISGFEQLKKAQEIRSSNEQRAKDNPFSIPQGGALIAELSGVGAVIGAAMTAHSALSSVLDAQAEKARRAREAQAAFTRALGDYALVQRTLLEDQLRQNANAATQIAVNQAANSAGVRVSGLQLNSSDELQRFIDSLTVPAFSKFRAELERLHAQMKANEEIIRRRVELEKQQTTEDLTVRLLRAQGLESEADALAAANQATRERQALIDKFGEGAEVALLRIVQAWEEVRRAARVAEDNRRRISDWEIGTLSFTDPKAAEWQRLQEDQMRRWTDAMDRGASAAELAAIQIYNLAETVAYQARILEEDTRTREGFIAQGLGLLGDTRGQEDSDMFARQRQAWTDAIAEGMSPSNMALMAFTHFMEREQRAMQRAIEDQTRAVREAADAQIKAIDEQIDEIRRAAAEQIKAIDAQIDETRKQAAATAKMYDDQIAAIQKRTTEERAIIDEQLKVARQSLDTEQNALRVAEQQMQATQRAFDALQTFERSLTSGPQSLLSPTDRLTAMRAEFEAMAAQAAGGDANAAGGLPAAAQALLQASQAVNASGDGFVTDFQRVRAVITDMTAKYGTQLSHEQRMVDSQRAAVEAIRDQIDVLEEQKEVLLKASSDEIAALRELKEKASEDARLIIEQLQEQKEQVKTLAESQIDELIKTRDAIESEAQRQIEHIIRVENEAYLARIEAHEYYNTFRQHVDEQRQRDELFYGEMLRWIESPASLPERQLSPSTPVALPPTVTTPVPVTVDNREVVKQLESIVESQTEEIKHLTAAVIVLQEGFKQLSETNNLLRESNRLSRRIEDRLPS